ncbi:MAG: hypothetical protein WDN49_27625 [Acetobacteraceae bacterium]
MTDEEAQGVGIAAWMLMRTLAVELAESGVVPPKRMRKLVGGLLEGVTELDRAADLSAETRGTVRPTAGGAAPFAESEPGDRIEVRSRLGILRRIILFGRPGRGNP